MFLAIIWDYLLPKLFEISDLEKVVRLLRIPMDAQISQMLVFYGFYCIHLSRLLFLLLSIIYI